MNSGGRRVAVAATLLGLGVLLTAGAVWWRSLGVEIEIIPDREVWQPGENITGKVVLRNRTFRDLKLSQYEVSCIEPLDAEGNRVPWAGTRFNEPSPIQLNWRGSEVKVDFMILSAQRNCGYWMPRGEFLLFLAPAMVEEFARIGVRVKIRQGRVLVQGGTDPFYRQRIMRIGVCDARIVVLRDDGVIESRDYETGRLLIRVKLDESWFEDLIWNANWDLDLDCSSDGVWLATLHGGELKLRRIDGASRPSGSVSIPLGNSELLGIDRESGRFIVEAFGPIFFEIDPASHAVTTRQAMPPKQAPRPLPEWFRQIDDRIQPVSLTEKK